MDSYRLAAIQLACHTVHQEFEILHVPGNSTIIDREVEILNAAGAAAFLLQNQAQFLNLILREHGDKNVNSRVLEPRKIIVEPVTTTRARSNGQPQ